MVPTNRVTACVSTSSEGRILIRNYLCLVQWLCAMLIFCSFVWSEMTEPFVAGAILWRVCSRRDHRQKFRYFCFLSVFLFIHGTIRDINWLRVHMFRHTALQCRGTGTGVICVCVCVLWNWTRNVCDRSRLPTPHAVQHAGHLLDTCVKFVVQLPTHIRWLGF